jgi:Na+-transporting methylmalonyl-CoA/oxaloacetate decarboxylase beta subunit
MKNNALYKSVLRLAFLHFVYILAFVAATIVFHASNLVPPESILARWQAIVMMIVATTVVWYLAILKKDSPALLKSLLVGLILADIGFASFVVYQERGMASLGVALYAVPIAVAATMLNRTALFATATLCAAAYSLTTVKYFVDFFNEGYKVQLYATIGFYAAMFFVLAALLNILVSTAKSRK